MASKPEVFLITLATGRQGTSTAKELLKNGKVVRACVRDKNSASAKALEALGCILIEGSAEDLSVIKNAMVGVTGLFLNIFPNPQDPTAELRQASNFLSSARDAATVSSVVVTTALHTPMHQKWISENPHYPMAFYYARKFEIEGAVRKSGIQYYTILRPSWLMHNYLEPGCRQHYPNYQTEHILDVAYPVDTLTAHFAPYDVGKFASAAFLQPEKFAGHEIELGNQQLTIEDVASSISKVTGVQMRTKHLSAEEVDEIAPRAPALAIRRWGIKEGAYTNDPTQLREYEIGLTTLEEFIQSERSSFRETLGVPDLKR